MDLETENIEFKSGYTEDIYKEVIAFANTDGGILYIGIDDRGNAVGLSDVDEELNRITNGIRDAILPDVTMCIKYTVQENKVVRILVNEGSNKPYYLKAKGLKPSGVFVRQGTSAAPASPEQIRQMIKDSDGDNFEELRSTEQTLTFDEAEKAFRRYGVEFNENKFRALGVVQPDGGIFTNLGLLLSDRCRHTVKIAVFEDETNTVFLDSKEFGGSVLCQLEEAFGYLSLCNKKHSTITGLVRTDKPDYPEEALREALLNALIHRDYGFSGSIIINVNEKQIEFISIGGLLPGLTCEDIRLGISQPRNKKLAEVFHRLRLIESYGTGIRRIYKLYGNCTAQPKIEVSSNVFRIILPNMNFESKQADQPLTDQMRKILGFMASHGGITDAEISSLLGLKKTRTFTIAKQMRDLGLIEAVGKGASKHYERKKTDPVSG